MKNNKMKQLQKLLASIPRGKITSYKIVAKKLKMHPRAVGVLLHQNPYPNKYPCYKVVGHCGRIGGYAKGEREKIRRLRKDGIEIHNSRIEMEKYCYRF